MPVVTAKYTRVFAETNASKKRIIVNVGGARSSKSYSIAQVFVSRFLMRKNKEVIVGRKTFPALKATAMADIIAIMREWSVYEYLQHNKTDHTIVHPLNNNLMRFLSIEDPTRIRSMKANDIWLEEANEFTYDDFVTLKTRLSAPTVEGERNQMFLSLNPSDSYGWINQKLVNAAKKEADEQIGEVDAIYSSYKDNPSLDSDYIKTLEDLKAEDETYYKIFALGVWAQSGSIIYSNYDIVPDSSFPDSYDDSFGGLDFGFNNPASATFVGVKDNVVWIKEIIYQSRLTNSQLIDRIKDEFQKWKLLHWRADESEPDRIAEFEAAGFNIEAAPKGKNSVRDGIDFCKRLKWHISNESLNVIKEVRGYKWKEKDGLILDEPVKYLDHSMDAIRYALTGLKSYNDPQTISGQSTHLQPGGRVRRMGGNIGDPRRYGKSSF